MAQTSTEALEFTIAAARDSFRRHLRASNKSPRTIQSYLEAVERFDAFLANQGMPQTVRGVRREHVEAWLVGLQEAGQAPATVANRYRSLRVFFGWLVEDDEIEHSPMERMRPPVIPEQPVPILPDEDVRALLATASGTSFDDRRDLAIMRLLIDCGLRRAECAGLRLEDVDFDRERVWVEEGKGRRGRWVVMRSKAANALDRYLRLRPRHPHHREPALWLGKRGPMLDSGILQMVRRRGKQAGIEHLYVHQLRHLAAHNAHQEGMSETDIMHQFGWRTRDMLRRYASSTSAERAQEHARQMRGGDRY